MQARARMLENVVLVQDPSNINGINLGKYQCEKSQSQCQVGCVLFAANYDRSGIAKAFNLAKLI